MPPVYPGPPGPKWKDPWNPKKKRYIYNDAVAHGMGSEAILRRLQNKHKGLSRLALNASINLNNMRNTEIQGLKNEAKKVGRAAQTVGRGVDYAVRREASGLSNIIHHRKPRKARDTSSGFVPGYRGPQ